MNKEKLRSYIAAGVTAFLVVAAAILLFFLLSWSSRIASMVGVVLHILRPIFIGMVLAFLLLPVQRHVLDFLLELTSSRGTVSRRRLNAVTFASVIISLVLAALVIYLLLAMVVPQVYYSIVGLVNAIPGYIGNLQEALTNFFKNNPEIQQDVISAYNSLATSFTDWVENNIVPNLESITATLNWIRTTVLPNLGGVMTSVYGVVFETAMLVKDVMIAVIVSVYLLLRKDLFAAQTKKIVYSILPTGAADLVVQETRNAYHILSGFISGKLVDSLIIGIISLIVCNILRFPYPALLATIIGVTNIIPFFGPFIGCVPCALLVLLSSPRQCIPFIIFNIILQQFDGNILGPKILGDSTGLASFWVLFSIILFGGLFGFAGMVLGVPVFAMIYSVVRRLVNLGLRHHGLSDRTADYTGNTPPLAKKKLPAESGSTAGE